jgi:hypothetical protein
MAGGCGTGPTQGGGRRSAALAASELFRLSDF